jgi:membrane protein implicated in regulation of membrane protease activity
VIPLLWLIAGVLLIAVEMLSGEFVLLMLGGAALVAAGASALGVPVGADVAVFAAAAAALVLLARPALRRRLDRRTPDGEVNAGPRALLGVHAEVVEPIRGEEAGTVRIAGALWTARALDEGAVLVTGDPVVVVDIRGATAVVAGSGAPTPHPPLQGES